MVSNMMVWWYHYYGSSIFNHLLTTRNYSVVYNRCQWGLSFMFFIDKSKFNAHDIICFRLVARLQPITFLSTFESNTHGVVCCLSIFALSLDYYKKYDLSHALHFLYYPFYYIINTNFARVINSLSFVHTLLWT